MRHACKPNIKYGNGTVTERQTYSGLAGLQILCGDMPPCRKYCREHEGGGVVVGIVALWVAPFFEQDGRQHQRQKATSRRQAYDSLHRMVYLVLLLGQGNRHRGHHALGSAEHLRPRHVVNELPQGLAGSLRRLWDSTFPASVFSSLPRGGN